MAKDLGYFLTIGHVPTGYYLWVAGSIYSEGNTVSLLSGATIKLTTTVDPSDTVSVNDYHLAVEAVNNSLVRVQLDSNWDDELDLYHIMVYDSVKIAVFMNESSGTDVTIGGVKLKGCTGAEYEGNQYSSLSVNGTTYNF